MTENSPTQTQTEVNVSSGETLSPSTRFYHSMFSGEQEVTTPVWPINTYIRQENAPDLIETDNLIQLIRKLPGNLSIFVVAGEEENERLFRISKDQRRGAFKIYVNDIDSEGRGFGYIGERRTHKPLWQGKPFIDFNGDSFPADGIPNVKAVYLPQKPYQTLNVALSTQKKVTLFDMMPQLREKRSPEL